ncbi:sensor histidine kinase [Nocardia rosealba]|uniref:sensor histidine kinase n=1 Tax=Nocardia rosealba TaxID=2878563 RepID=UPI001CD9F447|nr:histidine kinase [Nocardia rosealba]MCA2209045.1 histidine kinase [Nocardia rosealba]
MSRARVVDWVVAVGVAVALLVTGVSRAHGSPEWLGYALLVASGLALAGRRRAPVAVLVVTGLCAVGYQALGFDVPVVAFLFAVYFAVRAGHHVVTVIAAVALIVALPLAAMITLHDTAAALARGRDALELAWLIAAGAAGEALRQAERRADEAERTREETARRRADEERLHIARELHDSLTHQISVIKVQSEAAVHVARKRGEDVPAALLAIRDAGREAARDLRATLTALRDDEAPRPGLAHLDDLLERARAAGVATSLTVEGDRTDVPVAVDRTVYRIVQEALTNTTRHAGATTATVRVDYRADGLVIDVEDNGRAAPVGTGGVGLLGMRERVTALGGRLHTGPRPTGGFAVHAELPLERS